MGTRSRRTVVLSTLVRHSLEKGQPRVWAADSPRNQRENGRFATASRQNRTIGSTRGTARQSLQRQFGVVANKIRLVDPSRLTHKIFFPLGDHRGLTKSPGASVS
jgi:hypothetical protein